MRVVAEKIKKEQLPEVYAKAWDVARRLEVFGHAELQIEMTISYRVAAGAISAWEAEGRIRRRYDRRPKITTGADRRMYELTPAYREPKERQHQVARQLWKVARRLKEFTPTDLQAHTSADLAVTVDEASTYCQMLLRASYVCVLRRASPGYCEACYGLVRNTGPNAPVERRVRAIWDPNLGEYAFISGVGRIGGAS